VPTTSDAHSFGEPFRRWGKKLGKFEQTEYSRTLKAPRLGVPGGVLQKQASTIWERGVKLKDEKKQTQHYRREKTKLGKSFAGGDFGMSIATVDKGRAGGKDVPQGPREGIIQHGEFQQ